MIEFLNGGVLDSICRTWSSQARACPADGSTRRSTQGQQKSPAVRRRKELNCLKCHAIGGAGGRVGPDMVSLGSSAQIDDIAESLLASRQKGQREFQFAG